MVKGLAKSESQASRHYEDFLACIVIASYLQLIKYCMIA